MFLVSTLLAACGGGKSNGSPPPPPPVVDTTPDAFTFADQSGVAAGSEITSAPVTISGINAATAVTVADGTYSVGCGATFTAAAGSISNGETVCVRHTASAAPGTATHTTLTVGGVSGVFTSTTAAVVGSDTTPDAFSFTDQTGVATSTVITSAPVTITGIDAPAAVTVSGAGGTYSVDCTATYISTASTINNGQTVCARHTSAATAGTITSTTLTVGGVSAAFRSTTAGTAAAVVSLLPFLAANGEVRLFDPTVAASGSNPVTVDTGLAPPPAGAACVDCFRQAETYFTATVSGTTLSNLRAARLVYVKGGAVYKVDLSKGATNTPVQISSLTDGCRIVRSETTDFSNIDNTAVIVERPGPDAKCGDLAVYGDPDRADNTVTVIRLNSSVASAGLNIPLARGAGNPLHARTDASGAVTGYVSFEITGTAPLLVELVARDANLLNPTSLMTLESSFGVDTTGANLERSDLTHLFVTATRAGNGLQLFRIDGAGLSPALYSFTGFNAGNPIQDGLRDATNLYFSDHNLMLRVPVEAAAEGSAVILTTMSCNPPANPGDPNPCLRIENRALDTSGGRVVFEAQDDSISAAGGVFSVATTATNAPATLLANNGDGAGGYTVLAVATGGRAYINIAHHGGIPTHADALKINTDGTGPVTTTSAYWAGSNLATSFDLATTYSAPVAAIFLGTRFVNGDGTGTDTLYAVNPATGVTGATLGSVDNAAAFLSVNVSGLGRYALSRVERDRSGSLDYDVFAVDAESASSLAPLAQTAGGNDIPLDSLQRLTGNLCLLCL